MRELEKYCAKICRINGLDTYIISPRHRDDFVRDRELLGSLGILRRDFLLGRLPYIMETCRKYDGLYLALVRHRGMFKGISEWEPLLCYLHGEAFFHVSYHTSWKCRFCGNLYQGAMIMPAVEHSPDFYMETENRWPDTPSFFHEIHCPQCGLTLQNHWVLLK